MLGEVYAQAAYRVNNTVPVPPPGVGFGFQATQVGDVGYAIEIRNPHNYQISLDNVYLYVDGTNWGELSSATLANQNTLGPNEVLMLHRDSTSEGDGTHDDVTSLWDAGNVDADQAITQNWPTNPGLGAQDVTVELRAEASDNPGTPMDFAYQKAPAKSLPEDGQGTWTQADDPLNDILYHQEVTLGNGNGLNMLTVTEADWTETGSTLVTPYDASIDKLGEDAKGGPAGHGLDNTLHQFVLRNDVDGKIWHIGELASMAVFGLQNNQTLAEAWQSSGALEVNDLRLSFDPANLVDDAGQSAEKVPHAVWLLSRFTTHSPLSDIADNDGDGSADNQEEAMVYGRINLNTAPRTTIQALLPLADPVTRDDLATAIEDYRDDVAARDPALTARTSDPDDVGFAHVGELLTIEAFQALATDAAFAGDTRDVGGVDVDFTYDIGLGADGVEDDAEERYMLGKLVGQMATVRSDTFAAYVVIRGYRSDDDDFVESELVEQRRFVVLLDRSSVIDVDGRVRVLGVMDH